MKLRILTICIIMITPCLAKAQFARSDDGVKIAYQLQGNGDVALVFVHGWSCDATYWKYQVPHFAKKYKVVTVDLAGHGVSGLNRTNWTMDAFGKDVMAVVDTLSLDQYIFVGHSLGGLVVLEAARDNPEGLIGVIGVDVYRNIPKIRAVEEVEKSLDEGEAPYRENYAKKMRDFAPRFFVESSDSALVHWVSADMASNDPIAGIGTWRAYLLFMNNGFVGALTEVKVPIRGINADRRKTNLKAIQEYVPSFSVKIMSGVGHFLMMEKPSVFNVLLDDVLLELAGH